MNLPIFEWSRAGIASADRTVFGPEASKAPPLASVLEGTEWELLHSVTLGIDGYDLASTASELRVWNRLRGTDVFSLRIGGGCHHLRFASLEAPTVVAYEARTRLCERGELVAEFAPAWKDSDARRGVLGRVETSLPDLAAAAAALLLVRVQIGPTLGAPVVPDRPLGY